MGTLTLSAESLTFESTDEQTTPASQNVAVSVSGRALTDVNLSLAVEGSGIWAGFTSATYDVITVFPNEPLFLVSPGVHSARITVAACVRSTGCTQQLEGSPKTINVTYTKHGLGSTPGYLEYAVRNGASQADRTRALTVIGYPEQAWIATTNRPWLKLSRSTGSTADTTPIDVFIDESEGTIANGSYDALIRIETPLYDRSILARVAVDRTQVNTVAPYLGVLFDQREVIIRGDHLDSGEITGVQFGGTAASFRVVSSSEIRATTPGSLSTGNHAITLTGGAASAVSNASFQVVPPAFYFSTQMALPFPAAQDAEPVAIAYDAPGQRIFVAVDQPAGTRDFVASYTNQSVTTWAGRSVYTSFDTLRAMTLTLDGRSLLLSEDEVIFDVGGAPTSGLAVSNLMFNGDRYATLHSNGWATNFVNSIAVANDGRAVLVAAADAGAPRSAFRYSSLSPVMEGARWSAPSLERLTPADPSQSGLFEHGVAGATGDGSRVLIASSAAPGDVYEYDAATSSLRRTDQVMRASAIQLDRTGSRILLNNTDVYDSNFQLLGQLPNDTVAAVFSPTVSHLYTYNSSGQLSSFDVSGASVTPIGTWSPGASAGDPQRRIVMTITPEGWTLLIAGTAGVRVEPIPDNVR